MSCKTTCVHPTPAQAHCSACHVTFGGVTGFDSHRRGGGCLTPRALGMVDNGRGVWRSPMSEDAVSRLRRESEAAQNASAVGRDSTGASGGS